MKRMDFSGKRDGFIGVLMLDSAFPRAVGDIGNRNSFRGVPMRFATVSKVYPNRVLSSDLEGGLQTLFPAFLKAAQGLQSDGALGITTSCGFLAPLQQTMAARLSIPVALSSLLQVAWVQSLLPKGKVCGVITIDAERFRLGHLLAADAPAATPVVGMPKGGAFAELILADNPKGRQGFRHGDSVRLRRAIEAELIEAARQLPPNTGAIVLECTNLPPFRRVLHQLTGLPVYDIGTLVQWFWAGLRMP
jgi:hypothetical protein